MGDNAPICRFAEKPDCWKDATNFLHDNINDGNEEVLTAYENPTKSKEIG